MSSYDHAEQLRNTTTGIRLSWHWLGTRKTLADNQHAIIANAFDADPRRIRATKQLIDSKHEKLRALTKLKNEATSYVRDNSLPFPEPGLRLIKRDELPHIQSQLENFRSRLWEHVAQANDYYGDMVEQARTRLGDLFNHTDYPSSLTNEFGMEWDFPSVEPPPYLATLSPAIYAAECERVRDRFASAVTLAEDAFRAELAQLVTHLSERLTPTEEGTKKTFHGTTLENLTDFFGRFRNLNLTSSNELNTLVSQAEQVLSGASADTLRTDALLAAQIRGQLADISSTLDAMVITTSRRKIDRPVADQAVADQINTTSDPSPASLVA
jgi:hypothetical protein